MSPLHALVFTLGMWQPAVPAGPDLACLRETLQDRQHPRTQSQAALLLVRRHSKGAEEVVRHGLREVESPEVFLALAAALRLCPDHRFDEELLAALKRGRPAVRQGAAEVLALQADDALLDRLRDLADDAGAEIGARQAALWALGRSGRKQAAVILLDRLSGDPELLRQSAAEALSELSGQAFGTDPAAWRSWWKDHQDLSDEDWLQERLVYQAGRSRRLEGELDRARAQILRLEQQLYARLPAADRVGHVQGLVENEDADLRALAVTWAVELLPAADAVGRRALGEALLRLSEDAAVEVQRPAVLALGRVLDARAFDRLIALLRQGPPAVRAAAARALTRQALAAWEADKPGKLEGPVAVVSAPSAPSSPLPFTPSRSRVVPALQQALDDPSVEVVIEAAEDLGSLGAPEAGPVLTGLLRHPSEPVRQTAAQALERVADRTVLDGLLAALDDPGAGVRFSLIGALGHAIAEGAPPEEAVRSRLLQRLQELLVRDPDAGVRSRAATLLGECGPPEVLPVLWQRVLTAEDGRVQEKAWAALAAIVSRSGSVDLLGQWDRKLAEAGQGVRRVQMLASVCDSWKKGERAHGQAPAAAELLVKAQLEGGAWAAALPLVRDLLTQPGSDAELDRRLHWLAEAGRQALRQGNREEALRVVRDAQPLLARSRTSAAEFEQLDKEARQGP